MDFTVRRRSRKVQVKILKNQRQQKRRKKGRSKTGNRTENREQDGSRTKDSPGGNRERRAERIGPDAGRVDILRKSNREWRMLTAPSFGAQAHTPSLLPGLLYSLT